MSIFVGPVTYIASVLKKELNLMEFLIQNFLGFFMVICKINIYQNYATKSELYYFSHHTHMHTYVCGYEYVYDNE